MYDQIRKRLKNMKFEARDVECLQSIKSMCVNLKVVVRKIERMEDELDHSVGETVNIIHLEKYLRGLGDKWERDHNLEVELAALGGKKANVTQQQPASGINPTLPKPKKPWDKKPSAGKVDCFYHLDFGHEVKCPIPGCYDRKLHDAAKAGQSKADSYAPDGTKLCPYRRRMGRCTSPKCEFCIKPVAAAVPPSQTMMAAASQPAPPVAAAVGIPRWEACLLSSSKLSWHMWKRTASPSSWML